MKFSEMRKVSFPRLHSSTVSQKTPRSLNWALRFLALVIPAGSTCPNSSIVMSHAQYPMSKLLEGNPISASLLMATVLFIGALHIKTTTKNPRECIRTFIAIGSNPGARYT